MKRIQERFSKQTTDKGMERCRETTRDSAGLEGPYHPWTQKNEGRQQLPEDRKRKLYTAGHLKTI